MLLASCCGVGVFWLRNNALSRRHCSRRSRSRTIFGVDRLADCRWCTYVRCCVCCVVDPLSVAGDAMRCCTKWVFLVLSVSGRAAPASDSSAFQLRFAKNNFHPIHARKSTRLIRFQAYILPCCHVLVTVLRQRPRSRVDWKIDKWGSSTVRSTDSQSWQTLHIDSNKSWLNRRVRFFGKWKPNPVVTSRNAVPASV